MATMEEPYVYFALQTFFKHYVPRSLWFLLSELGKIKDVVVISRQSKGCLDHLMEISGST